jgi:flagellin-like hook-associated protein FlgL
LDDEGLFAALPAYSTRQGAEWSSSSTYDQGQIVLHNGRYFQCQVDDFKNTINSLQGNSQIIQPDDEFITIIQGEPGEQREVEVANDIWLPLGESLDYVLKFKTTHQESPKVSIYPAGSSGRDASAEAIVDADGQVVGLKLLDPGRYFFGSASKEDLPPAFEQATIALQDGSQLTAKIIWEEDATDPGPFRISGFELDDQGNGIAHDAQSAPRLGDTFSFATGSKTFLDHRDEDGQLLSVTYQGGDENAITRVGKDTDVSYMLDASNGNTAVLGNVVNSLVELRDGLFETAQSTAPSTVPETEKDLIALEDLIIDKMGELSSTMVRMETVRNHDEDYVMALDKQISKDLEIDMSEAIMRLSKVSTAYQAAMQVGAQLLNNSLLNYL